MSAAQSARLTELERELAVLQTQAVETLRHAKRKVEGLEAKVNKLQREVEGVRALIEQDLRSRK